jgi:hypothetical protein
MIQPNRSGFMPRIAILIALIGGTLAAGTVHAPAQSRLAWIFDDPTPRPPADVPGGAFPPQPPPVHYPGPAPLPAPSPAPPSAIQTQPLAPPPGAAIAPANAPLVAPPDAVQPAALPPASPGAPQQPAEGSPQLDDTVVTEVPTQKIDNGRAVFSGLDKITGRIISFDAGIGETVQFGALRVTTRACYTRPPTEATNTDAFVEVDEVTLQGEVKRVFSGWMFAASPGLHAVEHPIYDVWLTDCASPVPTKVAQPATPPVPDVAPAAQPRPPSRTRQGGARQQNTPGSPAPVQVQPN